MFDELTTRVIEILSETQHIPVEQISVDSSFEDLNMDSLGAFSLVYELEQEFHIDIPNEEVLRVRSVRQLVESLLRALPAGSAEAEAAA